MVTLLENGGQLPLGWEFKYLGVLVTGEDNMVREIYWQIGVTSTVMRVIEGEGGAECEGDTLTSPVIDLRSNTASLTYGDV